MGTVDWRLSRKTYEMHEYQVKCAHFTHFKLKYLKMKTNKKILNKRKERCMAFFAFNTTGHLGLSKTLKMKVS